jgi:hypothetical protein
MLGRMTNAGHIIDWISERLRGLIIDDDLSKEEAVGQVLDGLNREDRQVLARFFVESKAQAFVNLKQAVSKMLDDHS